MKYELNPEYTYMIYGIRLYGYDRRKNVLYNVVGRNDGEILYCQVMEAAMPTEIQKILPVLKRDSRIKDTKHL